MPDSENSNQPIVLAGVIDVQAVFLTHEQAMSLLEPGALFGARIDIIPLSVPVILCLSKGQGTGVQVPIADTSRLRGSEHCLACVSRTYCDNHATLAQPKET
jgi:hypothetical protein